MPRRFVHFVHHPTSALLAQAAFVLLLLCARPSLSSAADEAPVSVTSAYSPYELLVIADAEKALGSEVDPKAEGKIIESIETFRLDPIDKRSPAPLFLNSAHITTKDDLVRHEVLLRVGERYRRVVADESARNIRSFARMSIVVVTALRGSAPDRVRIVVITKDVWTLILDADLKIVSGGVESLMFELKEQNFLGRQAALSARSILQPESISFGAGYLAPRFEGRWLKFATEANVIVNRRSGEPEGSFGDAKIERPLYSTRTEWAWSTAVNWRDEVYRRYSNAAVANFDNGVPWVFRSRRIEQQASVTRSLGWARKNDFTVGLQLVRDVYRVQDSTTNSITSLPNEPFPNEARVQAAVDEFVRAAVPVGETRASPFIQWRSYANDFLRIIDFETLSLQEDYRLGYDIVLRGYPVVRAFGSTRDLVGFRAAASYTIAMKDGFARALIDTITEAEVERIPDASIGAELRLVSPRTPLGRIVFDVLANNRWRNYLNRLSFVGGEDRLRGWPTRYFVGKNLFAANLEFRTRAVQLWSLQLGLAAFYDTGKAFNGTFDQISPAHSLGVGVRAVIPEVDRVVLRGDLGFPIAPAGLPPGVLPISFFISFHQAFRTAHMAGPMGP